MSRLGGWDVYKEMRANARANRVPVLIVTGSDVRELEPSDGRYFLRKPMSADTLVVAVEQAMRGRAAGTESTGE